MNRQTSLDQIDEIIERAGRELGWTTNYVDLLATVASRVFAAHGNPDHLPVGRTESASQIAVLRSALEAAGKTPKTAATYGSAWQRISTITEDWATAGDEGRTTAFWTEFATTYRDSRLERRRTRKVRPTDQLTRPDLATGKSTTYEVRLDAGIATITIPDHVTSDDVITLIEALTQHLRAHRSDDTAG